MSKDEFAECIQLLKNQLYRTAYLYLNDEASALDAVDEAVYKVTLMRKKTNTRMIQRNFM